MHFRSVIKLEKVSWRPVIVTRISRYLKWRLHLPRCAVCDYPAGLTARNDRSPLNPALRTRTPRTKFARNERTRRGNAERSRIQFDCVGRELIDAWENPWRHGHLANFTLIRTTGMFPMRKMLSWRCGDVLVYIDILITIGAWIPRVSVAQTRNLGKSCGKVRGAKLRTKDVSLKLIAWSVRFRAASNSSPPC